MAITKLDVLVELAYAILFAGEADAVYEVAEMFELDPEVVKAVKKEYAAQFNGLRDHLKQVIADFVTQVTEG